MSNSRLLLLLLPLAGCTDVFRNAESWDMVADDDESTTGGEGDDDSSGAPETSGTGQPSEPSTPSPGETGGDQELAGLPPEILALSVSPEKVFEAGPILVTVEHTNAGYVSLVAEAEIRGEMRTLTLVDGPASSVTWPVEFAVTSEEAFEGLWKLRADVDNAFGTAHASTMVAVELPPGGQEVWAQELDGPSSFNYGQAIAVHPEGVAVLVRVDLIGGAAALVRLHDESTGALVWESETLTDLRPGGLIAFPDGRILIAGTDVALERAKTLTFQPDQATTPIDSWTAGTLANEARAVARAADGSYVIAGVEHKADHDDVIVWSFPADMMPAILRWAGPVPEDERDEVARAVHVDEARILVAGTAELIDDDNPWLPRMFVVEYARDHTFERWWGHFTGELEQKSDAFGVVNDGLGGVVVVGSSRLDPLSPWLAEVIHLSPTGDGFVEVGHLLEGVEGRVAGVALDPSGRVVVGFTNGLAVPATLDVAVLNLVSGAVSWQVSYEHVLAGSVAAAGLEVDFFGYVYFVGSEVDNDGVQMIAGKRCP